ncbi:Swarming motility protein YbiA [Rosistilla carotiformis]|uniref:Swarming motility protein YbiA n=1 Tax=Rosistilla carotiformis TaxID=2528017 RepID=A0A518JTZ1_9BACT|nr:NADAR family protein [Rosistilla carotiformis]QDV69021.1 Swarming motility protein YbiA [Rosistilla carotiformis]
MLDLETLRQRCSTGEQFDYLYFWGHQSSKDGKITKSCLSQWYESSFTVDGTVYQTAEHWMMAAKARLFGDEESLLQILESSDPKTAKALGRKVKNFDSSLWDENARRLVTEGNVAKFSQNSHLQEFLLGTGDAVLVEASPYDRIWGIGLKADDDRAKNPVTWQGQNLLGFALMDVREELSKQSGTTAPKE